MESLNVTEFLYENLNEFTNGFSEENFVSNFQFGKVYRGKMPPGIYGKEAKDVMVKIWDASNNRLYRVYHPVENRVRLAEEVVLLKHRTMNSHPNLVKLVGFCWQNDKLGAVYDLDPLHTLRDLIPKGCFDWLKRMKVAVEFARVLAFFHAPKKCFLPYGPYLIRNVDATHIMLDKDYNTKLFDFSMVSGGMFPDRNKVRLHALRGYTSGCIGYVDTCFAYTGGWCEKNDVYAFGVILVGLIAKRVFNTDTDMDTNIPFVDDWALSLYEKQPKFSLIDKGLAWVSSVYKKKQSKFSLVDQSLEADPAFNSSDGHKLTKLAMWCLKYFPRDRPTMKQVIKCLLDLHVVKIHASTLGLNTKLDHAFSVV